MIPLFRSLGDKIYNISLRKQINKIEDIIMSTDNV